VVVRIDEARRDQTPTRIDDAPRGRLCAGATGRLDEAIFDRYPPAWQVVTCLRYDQFGVCDQVAGGVEGRGSADIIVLR